MIITAVECKCWIEELFTNREDAEKWISKHKDKCEDKLVMKDVEIKKFPFYAIGYMPNTLMYFKNKRETVDYITNILNPALIEKGWDLDENYERIETTMLIVFKIRKKDCIHKMRYYPQLFDHEHINLNEYISEEGVIDRDLLLSENRFLNWKPKKIVQNNF